MQGEYTSSEPRTQHVKRREEPRPEGSGFASRALTVAALHPLRVAGNLNSSGTT